MRFGMSRFVGKVALVSGGADGMGAACVERLATEGARVLILDVKHEMAEALAARLRAEGAQAEAWRGDVLDEAEFQAGLSAATAAAARIDILINIAGGSAPGQIGDMDLATWDRLYRLNIRSTLLACRAVLPKMRAQRSGVIVNMASISGIASDPGWGAYNSAKAGIIALTKALAWEEGVHGIRVNAICPGPTASRRLLDFLTPERVREFSRACALGRMASAEEQAGAILFLASDDAAFVTGTTLVSDGGLTARGWQPTDFDRKRAADEA
jgi:NAD(P)-dependent dehydrogenase (short-subunit alcohol dehydrogenase family)